MAAGNVDAATLARALTAAMTSGAGSAGVGTAPSAAASQFAPGSRGPAAAQGRQGRPRVVRVTPQGLARMLAKAMSEAGIGVVSAQQPQAEEPPQPDQ